MNANDRRKYATNRTKDGCIPKFQVDIERQLDSSKINKKNHVRHEIADFSECMRKNHSETMADEIPNSHTSADVCKPHRHRLLTTKYPNSKIMSNDDLYNKIHNSSSIRTKIPSDNSMTHRKLNSKRENIHDSISIIPNEAEGGEFSECEYRCDLRKKDYDDDESDDDTDYETDDYQNESQQQIKEYKGACKKIIESDAVRDEYIEELLRRRLRNEREIDKILEATKYHRMKGDKTNSGASEEGKPVLVKTYTKCSHCGKTSETSIKPPIPRNRRGLYDDGEFLPNSTKFLEDTRMGNFESVSTEAMHWPKLRKSRNTPKRG